MTGRFAPSPTGPLHLGNLRTATIAWLAARADGGRFIVRMEDLDRVQSAPEHERRQLDDLAALGLVHDGEVVRQSERFEMYHDALADLRRAGLVYECFCSRREVRAEIADSPNAPHLPPGSYPGTCRRLDSRRRSELVARGRPPALRLRATESLGADPEVGELIEFDDLVSGTSRGGVDDVVLRRNDGVPAYNLAVVVDDAAQDVTQVVRGDDLLTSTPRQIHLQHLLGLATPTYAHVPLVVGEDGERLAKRDGPITLGELGAEGVTASQVLVEILRSIEPTARSVDAVEPGAVVDEVLAAALDRFDLGAIGRDEIVLTHGSGSGRSTVALRPASDGQG
ncbi:tRNA glutamyl-Q(34) synthetase GluQRS [Ilumatobacter sp.]|uniref:tRNA glutamyl-Q(34) synthetase GluQRS n=1 Tax=Ilumatobacter sp. TaxID=1967498 RepID=UPI003B528234